MLELVGLQYDIAWENPTENIARTRLLIDSQPGDGTGDQLLVLPEMWATGFSMDTAVTTAAHQDSKEHLRALAKSTGSYTLGGVVSSGGSPDALAKNQAVAFSPEGEEIARYQKNRTFRYTGESDHYENGTELARFECGGLQICPLICYDLRFPELFRRGVAQGAEVFVVIANWPIVRVEHWVTLLRARAIENLAYVVGLNRCGSDPKLSYPGRSLVIDPLGEVIADAGDSEGILRASLDPAVVRDWRREFPALRDLEC